MYPVLLGSQAEMDQIMTGAANGTFSKMFMNAFSSVWNFTSDYILRLMRLAFYGIWNAFLRILWLLEQIFDIFSGVSTVYVKDASGNYQGNVSLIEAVFTGSKVQNAFWYLTITGMVLCFFFTIISVIRSMGDSLGQMKRPVTAVLRTSAKAALTFFMVPTACLAVIKVTTAITTIIVNLSEVPDSRLCDCIFYMCVGENFKTADAQQKALTGRYFLTMDAMDSIYYQRINYLVAFTVTLFMVVVMITLILQLIFRIMMVTTLFIVSPFFVSSIPLDDGEKFQGWTRMFTAFALSSFGPIFVMRLYTVIVPMIGPLGTIGFEQGFNAITASMLRIVFIMGGAYAAWQSQYLLIEIIDPSAAMFLKRSQVMMEMAKQAADAAVTYVSGGANKALSALGKGGEGKG